MNANTSTKKVTTAQKRKQYNTTAMNQILSFGAILKQLQLDADCTDITGLQQKAADAKKALADAKKANAADAEIKHLQDCKKAADERLNQMQQRAASADVQQRLAEFTALIDGCKFTRADLTPAFLREWLPNAIDSAGRICDCKKIALADEVQARADAAAGLYEIAENGAIMYKLVPVMQWTAGRMIQKFAAAAKMRAAHQKAANQAERDAARAKKAADELQALRAKVARLEKLAAADAAAGEILSAMKADAAANADAVQQ